MTVAAQTPAVSYIENGVTTAFPVPFRYDSPSDLRPVRRTADGTETALVYGIDFTATPGPTDAGGTLNVAAPAVAGTVLLIDRNTARAQTADYIESGAFTAESHEAALDKAMLINQEQDVLLARAMKVPPGEPAITLAPAAQREGRIPQFSANGLEYVLPENIGGVGPEGPAGGVAPVSNYGALSPAATALATVEAAFAALGAGGMLVSTDEASIGTTAPSNPGVEIIGEKGIYFEGASGGRRLVNKPGRDASLHQAGRENLVRWLEGLRTGETLKVALVGDSNTESYVGAALATALDSLANVSVLNAGTSGTTMEQWRTATGAYASNGKSQADVIAFDPDLMVICFNTNDPVVGSRTAAQVAATMAASLAAIRASLPAQTCSIALLTPNAMGDTSDRDELWSLQIRPIMRAMAERFECAFFDKNALFPNSAIDLAAGAMQNKWLDSARVHTATLATNILAAMIAEWLVPRELWGLTWDNMQPKAAADLPSTYPPGLSIARMTDGQFNGFVATVNPISTGGHFPVQLNWAFSGSDARVAIRVAPGGVWFAWQVLGSDPVQNVGSIAPGFNNTGLFSTALNTQRDGNMVSLDGRLNVSPPAQVLTATTLCNIATVSHRPLVNMSSAILEVINAGGTVELLRCDVTTAGNVVVRESSTMTDATLVQLHASYRGAI